MTMHVRELIDIKADFYSSIAAIDTLIVNFNDGKITPSTYHRQLKSLLRDFYRAKEILYKKRLNLHIFLAQENIPKKFQYATHRLYLTDQRSNLAFQQGTMQNYPEDTETKQYKPDLKLASLTAKLVACLITISDCARLKVATTPEMLLPLLEEAKLIIQGIPLVDERYWVLDSIRNWHDKISKQELKLTLIEGEAAKLSLDAERWLLDFRTRLETGVQAPKVPSPEREKIPLSR